MSLELLKMHIESEQDSIEEGTELFEYVDKLPTKSFRLGDFIYTLSLHYYQDVPEYGVLKVDLHDCVTL